MDTVVDPEGVMHDKYTAAGHHKNNSWDDGAGGRVTYIGICYGDCIYSIQTTYLRQGTQLMSRKHGGNQGNLFRVKLREPLTWVSGHYGTVCLDPEEFHVDEEECPWNFMKVITSLKFGTGQTTYGPFGKEAGTPFSFDSGTEITGFHGNSSNNQYGYLHRIGVYARCPATCFLDDPPVSAVKRFSLPETASCSQFSVKSEETP